MKNYIGTKQIQAKPMNRQEYNDLRGWTVPENENPNDDGYLVVYSDSLDRNVDGYDGYVSWSPKTEFEKAYRSFESGMSFGQAVELLKQDKRMARSGWNGKGMFLLIIKGESLTQQINDVYGNPDEPQSALPVLDAIYMKTADNKLVPWLASQTDILSEDWVIV